jgi:hypothetical protein
MIFVALALLAPVSTEVILPPRPDTPTAAEKAILVSAAAKCGMHNGAAYFIQEEVPREPLIHITQSLGDTEEQVMCVLQGLPKDWSMKFGLLTDSPRRR